MSSGCDGKTSWPELVGTNGHEAAKIIEAENPLVKAIVLPPGTGIDKMFRCDRVAVYVDSNDIVISAPGVG